MKAITIRTQKELDNISQDYRGIVIVDGGEILEPIKIENRAFNRIEIIDKSVVYVTGQDKVCAFDDSVVEVNSSKIIAFDNSSITAYGNSIVTAHDNSNVCAYGKTIVKAYNNSIIVGFHDSEVISYDSADVTAHDKIKVKTFDSSQVDIFDYGEYLDSEYLD